MTDFGVGVGLRREMMGDLEEVCRNADFIEINCPRVWSPESLRENLEFVAEQRPVAVHSITLSVGTDDEFDPPALDFVREVADVVRAPWVSEHLSFSDAGDVSISSFIPMPYTDEAIEVVARKVGVMKRVIGRPIILENVTHSIRWPQDEMSEVEFINRVLREADCGLLLDVTNLHINAHTFRYDEWDFLRSLDVERVVQMHVAGYTERDGVWHDSHVGGVNQAVLDLAEWVFEHTPCQAAIIERDQDLTGIGDVVADIDRLRATYRHARRREVRRV